MTDIIITGLRRMSNPRPNRGGSTILAFFDCEARGIVFNGCAFARTRRQGLTVWPPNVESHDARRAIHFADDALRHQIMLHAREAYRALGGEDAEHVGSAIIAGPNDAG